MRETGAWTQCKGAHVKHAAIPFFAASNQTAPIPIRAPLTSLPCRAAPGDIPLRTHALRSLPSAASRKALPLPRRQFLRNLLPLPATRAWLHLHAPPASPKHVATQLLLPHILHAPRAVSISNLPVLPHSLPFTFTPSLRRSHMPPLRKPPFAHTAPASTKPLSRYSSRTLHTQAFSRSQTRKHVAKSIFHITPRFSTQTRTVTSTSLFHFASSLPCLTR